MKEIIKELEKKQTEIYTDIEDFENFYSCTKEYSNGFEKGWIAAFDMAIQILKNI